MREMAAIFTMVAIRVFARNSNGDHTRGRPRYLLDASLNRGTPNTELMRSVQSILHLHQSPEASP
jgi:hypothetical protein